MKKLISRSIYIGAFLLLFIGFHQLGSQQPVFAQMLALCCDNNACDQSPCGYASTAHIKGYCYQEQSFTCKDCIDAIGSVNICEQSASYYTYCYLTDGRRYSSYYGTENPLSVSITGPTSLDPYEEGNFTANVTGGVTPYSYEWKIYYPCDDRSLTLNEKGDQVIPNLPPCGYWESLQSTQNSLERYDTRDFTLKCTVTDNHTITNNTAYSSIDVAITGKKKIIATLNNKNNLFMKSGFSSENKDLIRNNYVLDYNYPNPFNPSTNISYYLKTYGLTKLSVYDITGKLIEVLVNENQSPGQYRIPFNGKNLCSGIYVYRLTTNDYTSVKKMILIK